MIPEGTPPNLRKTDQPNSNRLEIKSTAESTSKVRTNEEAIEIFESKKIESEKKEKKGFFDTIKTGVKDVKKKISGKIVAEKTRHIPIVPELTPSDAEIIIRNFNSNDYHQIADGMWLIIHKNSKSFILSNPDVINKVLIDFNQLIGKIGYTPNPLLYSKFVLTCVNCGHIPDPATEAQIMPYINKISEEIEITSQIQQNKLKQKLTPIKDDIIVLASSKNPITENQWHDMFENLQECFHFFPELKNAWKTLIENQIEVQNTKDNPLDLPKSMLVAESGMLKDLFEGAEGKPNFEIPSIFPPTDKSEEDIIISDKTKMQFFECLKGNVPPQNQIENIRALYALADYFRIDWLLKALKS